MNNTLFPNVSIDENDAIRAQWYAIWSVGFPKKGNINNWFVYHAQNDGDVLSSSCILYEHFKLKKLKELGCDPFSLDNVALTRLAKRDNFDDIIEYIEYLNDIHIILINQKIAQASHDYEYNIAQEYAFLKQLEYLKGEAYKKGYDVTFGALATVLPFVKNKGEFNKFNAEEIKVAKQFLSRLNDDIPYNILSKVYYKRFNIKVSPIIKNIYDELMIKEYK